MLDQRLRLARVVTLVDAVTGAETLARFAEAARQAAVADALVDLEDRPRAVRRCVARRASTRSIPAPSASSAPPRATRPPCCSRRRSPHPNPPPLAGEGVGHAASAPLLGHPPPLAGEGRVGVLQRGSAQPGAEAAHTHGVATFTMILDGAGQPARFRARARRAGAGPRQRSAAGQGPRALRRPPGPAGGRAGGAARDVHAGMARCLARRRPAAAASSLSSTTSRPTKSSRALPSPRRSSRIAGIPHRCSPCLHE